MKSKPTKEELRGMLEKGMSLYQISRLYNTTISVIFQLEKDYGIIPQYTSPKMIYRNISKEDLESMYIDEGMAQERIAEELGCSQVSVHNMMDYYHIQTRGCGKYTPRQRDIMYDKIKQMYKDEYTQEIIAEKVGYSQWHVSKILKECGVQTRPGGKFTPQQRALISDEIVQRYNNGETQEEIAENVGYSQVQVWRILNERGVSTRPGGKFTPRQRDIMYDKIKQMYNEGMTQEQIAEKVGYSVVHVGRILHEYDVQTRGSRGTITSQKVSLITAEEIQDIIDKGMNQHQISQHFGVSDWKIFDLCEKFGISGMVNNLRFTDPDYIEWRDAVLDRYHYTCQLCGKTGVRLEVHHIIKWADAPELRYNVDNGVPLCHECHQKVTGHEYEYAQYFLDITQPHYRDHDIIESMPWEPPLELHSIIDYSDNEVK